MPCPVCLGVPGSVLGGPVRAGGPREPSQPVCPVNGSLGPPSRPSADCRLLLCSGQELGMRALEPGHPLLLGSRVGGYISRGLQCREAVCTPSAPNTSEGRSPHRAGHRGTFPPNPHRRLEGVIRLVQPGGHRDLIAGTTRGSCKGWKDVGAQRGRGDPGRASTLQLPGVAVGSHRDASVDGGWARPISAGAPCRTPAPITPCLLVRGPARPPETRASAHVPRMVGSRGSAHRGPAPVTKR